MKITRKEWNKELVEEWLQTAALVDQSLPPVYHKGATKQRIEIQRTLTELLWDTDDIKKRTVVMEYFVYDEDADDVDSLVPSLGLIGTNVTTGVTVDDIFEINKVKDGDRWKIVVTVKDSDLLNYEELRAAQSSSDPEPQYTVAVIVSEPDGHKAELKDTIIRVIEIRDMNESPLFTVETCEIAENNQIGDSLGRVEHPSDIDSMSRIVDYYDNRFKLVGGDTALFDLRYDEPCFCIPYFCGFICGCCNNVFPIVAE